MIQQLLTQHNIKPRGVIVMGAHYFQERDMWLSMGVNDFVLIEPVVESYRIMQENAKGIPGAIAYNVAVGEKREDMMMILDTTNQRQSSSLLQPKLHLSNFPRVKFTHRQKTEVWPLDDLKFNREMFNVIYADLQGFELPAFKGAVKTLKHIDFIYTEISFVELYQGCTLLPELDSWMDKHGFKRVWLGDDRGGYSDCAFVKK